MENQLTDVGQVTIAASHNYLIITIIIGFTALLLRLGRSSIILNIYTVGLLRRGISPKQNKRTQISMPRVGFQHTTPAFEWVRALHALDRAAILVGHNHLTCKLLNS
jgi:hypothetical protein